MEPRVRYATTSDGVRIAFTVFGSGPPLVVPPLLIGSHLQMEWDVSSRRASYEKLAERTTVIRYEARGQGMSQRGVEDFSDTAMTRDLQAVCDAAGVATFSLYLHPAAGLVPQEFMLRFPERISHVAAWVFSRNDAASLTARQRRIDSLMDDDWELYTEIRSRLFLGWSGPNGEAMSALIRATHTAATLRASDAMLAGRRWPKGLQTASPLLLMHEASGFHPRTFRHLSDPLPSAAGATISLVIHLAMALLIFSFTCIAMSVVTYVMPAVADASIAFVIGSVVATTISGGFALYVWREGL